jgi:hypothetical protein
LNLIIESVWNAGKIQIKLDRFHTLVIVLNEHNIRNLRPPIKIIT